MDGYLKIKTKIDNSGVDKDISELENKIKKLQTDNSNKSQEANIMQREIDNYEKMQQKADEYKSKIDTLNKERQNMFSGNITRKLSDEQLPEYGRIVTELESVRNKYAQTTNEIDKQQPKIEKMYINLSKIKAKQSENNTKIAEYKSKIDQIKTDSIQNSLSGIGNKLTGQISTIGKMAMAVLGIRTAWGAVRSAISMVSQYNKQVSTDFDYMRYCIASMLAPAIQGLIKLLYTVLSYVNAISSAWFGINLFGNASVKNFKKMQSSAGGTAKSAKEIQKFLQGFDEMNVLQDNSNKDNSGSNGGVSLPSMDLSGIQGDVPKWLQWIIDNKDIVIAALAGMLAGLLALKLGFTGIESLGIGIMVAGIVLLIENIIKLIKDPSWENFSNVLLSLSLVVAGLALAIGGTLGVTLAGIASLIAGVALIIQGVVAYLKDPTWKNFGTILAGIAVVVGAVLLLIGGIPALITGLILLIAAIGLAIYKHWDEVKNVLGQVGQWIYDNVITPIGNFMKALIDSIISSFKFLFSIAEGIFTALLGIIIAPFETLWDTVKNVFNGVQTILQGISNVFKGIFTGDMKTTLEGFKQIFKRVFDSLWSIAKAPLNLIIRGINWLIKGANKIHFDTPDWVPGIGGKTFGINIPQIPLLAKGGVISQPTQAIIGEAGREAVVPLENNMEWLDILADKLANKIGTSGTNNIYLDGRLIQRQIAKHKEQLAFATNR
nr:MAG TPA_asm: minor tail protein [Caudoviricetes sp.]